MQPSAPVTRKVLLLSPSDDSSRNDLPDLIRYLRERIVNFQLAEKRALHRAPLGQLGQVLQGLRCNGHVGHELILSSVSRDVKRGRGFTI